MNYVGYLYTAGAWLFVVSAIVALLRAGSWTRAEERAAQREQAGQRR